jgi:hypothetical protein
MDGELTALVRLDCDPELDPETADRWARQLRAELAELDVGSVRLAPAAAPPGGTKAGDAVTIGAVLVALSASGGMLTTLVGTLRDWVGRRGGGHRVALTIDGDTIELAAATGDQQRDLIGAYLRRHAADRAG